MIEDVFERHVDRHRSVPDRGAVAQGLWPRLQPAARHLAHGRAAPASRWPCGTSSARRSTSRSTSCWAGSVHERLRSYTYIYPAGRRDRAIYADPGPLGAARRPVCRARLHCGEVRPGRPLFASFDPRQPSLERLELSETFCRKTARGRRRRKADLLFGTHGQFTVSGAIRLAQAARDLRAALVRGAGAARDARGDGGGRRAPSPFRSRPASG